MAAKIQFGVYELDLDAMELRKHGVRIRLQDQPFRVLARLIEQPGEIVTREQLKERIWPDDTFVDFDQSLNKAVNRIREALNDHAGQPRYIETVPRRGYRFIAPVAGSIPASPPSVASRLSTPQAASRMRSLGIAIIAAAGIFLVTFIAALAVRKPKTPGPQRAAVRITTDGNSLQPVLSRDGKMLAYTSVGNDGVGHIWVRQTGGAGALQITMGAGGESEPSFSPDGTNIAFRSETDGGGVYVVPTLGGVEPKLVAMGALQPRFSPDGEQLWCVKQINSGFRGILVPARGGAIATLPQKFSFLHPASGYQTAPVWAPDGKQILYLGRGKDDLRWRIGSPSGVESKVMNVPGWDGSLGRVPYVHAWTQMNDRRQWIVYSAATGDSLNLFRALVSPSGEILAGAEQLTAGAGLVPGATLSPDGKLAFASASLIEQIYRIPITTERVSAARTRIPRYHGLRNSSPSISRDGRWLAYAVPDLEYREASIRLRDLVDGTDRLLVEHLDPRAPDFISISPDGSKVVFSDFPRGGDPGDGWFCFVVAVRGGVPQKISQNCGAPRGFSSDGSTVLVQKLNKTGPDWIAAINLGSKQEKSFLSHSRDQFWHAFLSWDDRWVVFKTAEDWNHGRLLLAPVRDGVAGAESEWFAVTDGRHADDKPQFSPDGNQIYFTSDRDGYLCLWAQPLNHVTRRPDGDPYVVQHFHDDMGWFLKSYNPFVVGVSVARDKIMTNLLEAHSDIWMLQFD